MENKLLELPFVDIRNTQSNDEINKLVSQNSDLIFLSFDGCTYWLDKKSIKPDGSIELTHCISLDRECIKSEKEKIDILHLQKQIEEKNSEIMKLKCKIDELSGKNDSLNNNLKEALKNCEELKTPKRNGCSEWVSAKTLVNIIDLLTDKK